MSHINHKMEYVEIVLCGHKNSVAYIRINSLCSFIDECSPMLIFLWNDYERNYYWQLNIL